MVLKNRSSIKYVLGIAIIFIFSCSSEYKIIKQNSDYLKELYLDQSYKIGCGDVLRIVVWRHDNLTVDVVVRPDGRISMPLIGDVYAEGLSIDSMVHILNEKFGEFVNTPSVSITVSQINSLKIYVLGEVVHSGEYTLVSYMDVLQSIALAGGFTIYAKKNKVYVIRKHGQQKIKILFNYNQVIKGKNLEQNIPLKPGDVIVVP